MDNSDKTRTSSHDSWVVWDLNGYLDGISLIKNEMANVENYIQNIIYDMMCQLFNKGLKGDGVCRILEVEER